MEKFHKFSRNSKRMFKSLLKKEEVKDETLNFISHIHVEERLITWHLENFDRCPLNTGEYLQSPFFCSGYGSNTKWALRIYPRGKINPGKVGLYILKMASNAKIVVNFDFLFRAPDLENTYKVLEKQDVRMESEEYGSEIPSPCTKFLQKKYVTIICRLNVGYVEEVDDAENCSSGSPLCTLSGDLKELLSSGKFSDVTLQAGKEQFHVHKAVLSARSNVFSAMFDHPMEESKTSNVSIDDVEPSVLSHLLNYIYTGTVDDFTADKVTSLFAVADKYCLEDLQKRCVRVMLAKLCVDNVCKIATLADMHSEQNLKLAANYIFRKYKHEIFERKEWKMMIQQRPLLATEILQGVCTDFRTYTECYSFPRRLDSSASNS